MTDGGGRGRAHRVVRRREWDTLGSRVSGLEVYVQSIAEDVHALSEAVSETNRSIRRLSETTTEKLESLSARISTIGRIPGATLAAWAAVILAIVGLAANGYVRDQSRLEQTIKELTRETVEMSTSVSALRERSNRAADAVRDLDEKLQREVALINGETQSRVAALDEKLQIEITGVENRIDTEMAWIKDELREARAWRKDHDIRVRGLNESQNERLRALERAVFNDNTLPAAPTGGGIRR